MSTDTDTEPETRTPTRAQREHLERVAAGRSTTFETRPDVVHRCEGYGWTVRISDEVRPPFAPERRLTAAGITAIGRERYDALRPRRPVAKRSPIVDERTPCLCHCTREQHDDGGDGLCSRAELCDCEGYRPRDHAIARWLDADRIVRRAEHACGRTYGPSADLGMVGVAEVVVAIAKDLRRTAAAEVHRARGGTFR